MEHFGLWSVVPPVLAIGLAFATRQVLPSLFISIWVGATIFQHGNPVSGFTHMIGKYIAGSIADPWNAAIITINIVLGGTIGIIYKSGSAKAVADLLSRKAQDSKSGQLTTFFMESPFSLTITPTHSLWATPCARSATNSKYPVRN